MKRALLLYIIVLSWQHAQSQWTTSGSNIYNSNSGYVGIGTSTPGNKLEVATSTGNDGLKLSYSSGSWARIFGGSLGYTSFNYLTQAGDAGIVYGGTTNGSVNFGFVITPWESSTSGLRVDQYGNVGICTANPQGYQLAVNGSAIFTAAKIKAYNNWPDFVFDQSYSLRPLDSLASFIQTHHHLPDLPDAASVQATGIDLGQTDAALLKKIEELTLYILQQQKELEEQKARIVDLEQLNQAKSKD